MNFAMHNRNSVTEMMQDLQSTSETSPVTNTTTVTSTLDRTPNGMMRSLSGSNFTSLGGPTNWEQHQPSYLVGGPAIIPTFGNSFNTTTIQTRTLTTPYSTVRSIHSSLGTQSVHSPNNMYHTLSLSPRHDMNMSFMSPEYPSRSITLNTRSTSRFDNNSHLTTTTTTTISPKIIITPPPLHDQSNLITAPIISNVVVPSPSIHTPSANQATPCATSNIFFIHSLCQRFDIPPSCCILINTEPPAEQEDILSNIKNLIMEFIKQDNQNTDKSTSPSIRVLVFDKPKRYVWLSLDKLNRFMMMEMETIVHEQYKHMIKSTCRDVCQEYKIVLFNVTK